MLTLQDCNGLPVALTGTAHIVISFDGTGAATLQGVFRGRMDSSYAAMPDDRLFGCEVPKLAAELRAQIQSLSGSTVTE